MVGDSCPSGLLIRILQRKSPLGFDGVQSDDDSDDSDGDEDDEDDGVARVGMEFRKENTSKSSLPLSLFIPSPNLGIQASHVAL